MPDVIQVELPVQADEGMREMDIRTLTIDRKEKVVQIVLLQTDEAGAFVENGKTVNIRHEGIAATAILNTPTYAAVIQSVREQLVAGNSLPSPAVIVSK